MKIHKKGVEVLIFLGKDKKRFLFSVRKQEDWRKQGGKLYIGFAGIGGSPQKKETLVETAIREVKEETGCNIEILHSKETLICFPEKSEGKISKIKQKPAPIASFIKTYPYKGEQILLKCWTFMGKIKGSPKPSAEIPALIILPERLIAKTLKRPVSLSKLIKEGAKLIEGTKRVPRQALFQPIFSPEVLGEVTNGHLSKLLKN